MHYVFVWTFEDVVTLVTLTLFGALALFVRIANKIEKRRKKKGGVDGST